MTGALERAGAMLHAVHGTRGLTVAAGALLVLSLLEPLLPARSLAGVIVLPVFLLLVAGIATLPREAVAAQWRARSLTTDEDAVRKMLRRLVWPVALVILLQPGIFLALYGIPHFSPLTGLLSLDIVRRVAVVTLFLVLLLPILYLRSSRIYAPDIKARRPRDLPRADGSHAARNMMLWMLVVLLAAWAWLTWDFWRPFSLFAWPPGLETFRLGARGVAGVTFALGVPVLLWTTVVAHIALLRDLLPHGHWRRHPRRTALAGLHVALALTAVVLHTYNLHWIVHYRTAALL